jgi:hypothetical protein
MTVNGHEFVDGVFTFIGDPIIISTLTRVFSYYGALPEAEAELQALRAQKADADAAQASLDQALGEDPAAKASADAATAAAADALMAAELKALEQPKPDLRTTPGDSQDGLPSLAEAIGALDPENDVHWTSNNLPSLDHLLALTGKKPSRADVDAIAEGYTRNKARAARAA